MRIQHSPATVSAEGRSTQATVPLRGMGRPDGPMRRKSGDRPARLHGSALVGGALSESTSFQPAGWLPVFFRLPYRGFASRYGRRSVVRAPFRRASFRCGPRRRGTANRLGVQRSLRSEASRPCARGLAAGDYRAGIRHRGSPPGWRHVAAYGETGAGSRGGFGARGRLRHRRHRQPARRQRQHYSQRGDPPTQPADGGGPAALYSRTGLQPDRRHGRSGRPLHSRRL